MNPLTKLASDTLTYGLSSMVGRVLHYLLVPLYTSLLLPSEYGVITELYGYAAFLNVIYAYGMETTFFRFASVGDPTEVFRQGMGMLLVTSLLLSGMLACLATPLSQWLGYPGKEQYIYYLAAIVGIDTLLLIPFAQLRFRQQPLRFAVLKCGQIVFQIVINLLFLWILPGIYQGKFLTKWQTFIQYIYHPISPITVIFGANLVANACTLGWLGASLFSCHLPIRWPALRPMLQYALPLLAMGLAGITNEMLSRVLLKHLLPCNFYPGQSSEAVLGIFGACYKLSIFMSLAIQAFRQAAEPFFFKHSNNEDRSKLFSQVMHGYILVGCFIWFGVSVNLDLLGYLFLRQPIYRSCLEIVPYLSFAYFWLGIYYNLSVWFKLANKTYYGAVLTGIGAIITIALNLLLVPFWGYWGSVWATVGSYVTMAMACYYQGQQHYPVSYSVGPGLGMIGITLALIVLVRRVAYATWLSGILANLGLTFLVAVGIYVALRKLLYAQTNQ